jgi:glycosyltransferase involved in cell wall biosynthesis
LKPIFSIILPVFKTDKNFLEKNLNSVKKQTFKNFELIVINDGSGESYFNLDDLLASAFLNDKRVRLINHKTNRGLSAARNTGMNFASGKYILHMDSDDYWLCENTLSYLYRIMECDGCEILRYNGKYDINGKTHSSIFAPLDCVNVSCSTMPGLRAYQSIFLFVFRKSFLTRKKIQFDATIGIGEDAYFLSKALSKSKKVSSINKEFYAYRLHADSMMRAKWTLADFKSDEKAFLSVIKHFAKDQPSIQSFTKYRYNFYHFVALLPRVLKDLSRNEISEIVKIYNKNLSSLISKGDVTEARRIKLLLRLYRVFSDENWNFLNSKILGLMLFFHKELFFLYKKTSSKRLKFSEFISKINQFVRTKFDSKNEAKKNIFISGRICNEERKKEYDIINQDPETFKLGCSALLRVKNEEKTIRASIISIIDIVDEIVYIDNKSTDETVSIVENIEQNHINGSKIKIYQYPFDVAKCGEEHRQTSPTSLSSLVYYYNWSKSKCNFNTILKWDGDMVLKPGLETSQHLKNELTTIGTSDSLRAYKLEATTIYVKDSSYFLSVKEKNQETRIFRNLNSNFFEKGWDWEVLKLEKNTVVKALKQTKAFEIKYVDDDEFSHWSEMSFNSVRKVREFRNHRSLNLNFPFHESEMLKLNKAPF